MKGTHSVVHSLSFDSPLITVRTAEMPKKPAASTIAQRKVREERLEAAMEAPPKPARPAAVATLSRPAAGKAPAHTEGRVIYLGHIPHGFYEDQMSGTPSASNRPPPFSCRGGWISRDRRACRLFRPVRRGDARQGVAQ